MAAAYASLPRAPSRIKQSESRPVFGLNRACVVEVVRGHPSPYGGVAP
jgi:hypothetical protein